jgi:hypothetical protein
MKNLLSLACVTLFTSVATAELIEIPVGKREWTIRFDGPVLGRQEATILRDGFRFTGNSKRFNVSIFVEPPQSPTGENKECQEFYWKNASRNEMIKKDSVKITHTDKFYRVGYMVAGDVKGEKFTQSNVNYYFVFDGKWMDMHVSIIEPDAQDVEIIKKIDKTLKYAPDAASSSHIARFDLGDHGEISLEIPAGWEWSGRAIGKQGEAPVGFNIDSGFTQRSNDRFKLTLGYGPRQDFDLESLQQQVLTSTDQFVKGSVEKKQKLNEFKLLKGGGAYCVFTDAALVDKPVTQGSSKVMASGMIKPQDDMFGAVSIFADDAKSEAFKDMIKAISSVLVVR